MYGLQRQFVLGLDIGWLVKREKYKVTFSIHSSCPYSSRRGLKGVHNQSLNVKCMGKELGSVLTKLFLNGPGRLIYITIMGTAWNYFSAAFYIMKDNLFLYS